MIVVSIVLLFVVVCSGSPVDSLDFSANGVVAGTC